MYYEFEVERNGLLDSGVTSDKAQVHFAEPENTSYGEKVPVVGDTYAFKEDIKKEDWDDTHHEWTGEYWRVDLDTVRTVMNNVARAAGTVSADPEVIYESDSLNEFRGEIEIDDDTDETFEFIVGPNTGDERVSRSWAEDAADVGNFEGVEDFADRFNFDVVDDEVLFGEVDEPNSVGEVNGTPPSSANEDQYDLTG